MATRAKKSKKSEPETFDEGMKALESLVADLESGTLPLEKALESFERGVGLVRTLNERLNAAEKKIEVLSRGADGALATEELDPSEEDSA